jgi:hypothetical protein
MTTNRGDAGLRYAPRFHALFTHLERRQVLLMPRKDWAEISNFTEGQIVEIDIKKTPLARIATTDLKAVIGERLSESEVILEVYRNDPHDAPTTVNVDRYKVWERLPSHRDYLGMVNLASTEDNANMRGFIKDYVFLVKDEVTDGHWLSEFPPHVLAIIRPRNTSRA